MSNDTQQTNGPQLPAVRQGLSAVGILLSASKDLVVSCLAEGLGRVNLKALQALVDENIVTENRGGQDVAVIATATFRSELSNPKYAGWRLDRTAEGFARDEEGWYEQLYWRKDQQPSVVGTAQLPNERGVLEEVDVRLGRITTGDGGIVPAVIWDERTKNYRPGPPLICLFVREIDPGKMQATNSGRIIAYPIGLIDPNKLHRYNLQAQLKHHQGKAEEWPMIPAISNRLNQKHRFLNITPEVVDEPGGYPVTKEEKKNKALAAYDEFINGKEKTGFYRRAGIIAGKILVFSDALKTSIFPTGTSEDGRPIVEPVKVRIMELHNKILIIRVENLVSLVEGKRERLSADLQIPDPLGLIGGSCQTTNGLPKIKQLVKETIASPPLERIRGEDKWKELAPDTDGEDEVSAALSGFKTTLRYGAWKQLRDAAADIENTLAPATGTETLEANLQDLCEGDVTDEALLQAQDLNLESTQGNQLMLAILTSTVAGKYGLTEFNPDSWVLRRVYQNLLNALIAAAGRELPLPPEGDQEESNKGQRRATRA